MTETDIPPVEDTEPGDETPVLGLETGGAEPSLMDTFRQEYAELAETKTAMISVKGYERTGLQIKYRLPSSGKELDAIARKIQREVKDPYSRNLYIAMDTMITLCEGLYVQPEGVEEPVMLDPENTGIPCQFDGTLAGMMGMNGEVNTARQVVKHLFGNNDMAVLGHAERLSR